MTWLEFSAAIAWPVVVLVGIGVLGPGGVLQKSIGELADKLMSIKSSVDEFRVLSEQFNERQRAIGESLQWLNGAGNELSRISAALDSVRANTSEILLGQGEKEISEVSGEEEVSDEEPEGEGRADDAENRTPQQRYDSIYSRWGELTELIRQRIGPDNYDGRAIGSMARRLSHRSRANAISKEDAELIESLHSQFKRFGRLTATKDEWLTPELYENFIRGLDRAKRALQ